MAFCPRLIPPAAQRTSAWSGGTTTELAIFPPTAKYPERDFRWRLSTAVVTVPESTFTSLPAYHRLLMVLTGEMRLEHAGQHSVTLHPFEQDSFSGAWQTRCTGTGRDFNLMLAAGWQGELEPIRRQPDSSVAVVAPRPGATEAFYCVNGQALLRLAGGDQLIMSAGDFVLLEPESIADTAVPPGQLAVSSTGGADLIRATIWRE
jgi:environmental stress-induced protein Ves